MPRVKKSIPPGSMVPTPSLVASGHRFSGKVPRIYSPSTEWQAQAYRFYETIGEARYAANYFGHAMSRATFGAASLDGKHIESGPAAIYVNALLGDEAHDKIEAIGIHLTVAGECYIVGRDVDGVEVWEVLSVREISGAKSGRWTIRDVETGGTTHLAEEDTVIRIWTPMPGKRWEADSPFRSLLPVLDEIATLSAYIRAQLLSRLISNGLLVFPDGITFPPPPPVDGKEVVYANQADAFMMLFAQVAAEAIKNPGSAEAMLPIMIGADKDAIGEIKHLTFWTELDQQAREMRQDAIQRFAFGMDLPNEMVLGMGSNQGTGGGNSNGVSHWGAWMIEEQAIKIHVEPKLDALVSALTSYYLRPLTGSTEKVVYDTSRLRLRPDRSEESIELADRGWLSTRAVIRENGFSEEDQPTPQELTLFYLQKIATGSATPEQVQAALALLGVDLGPTPVPEVDSETRETPQSPSLEDHPRREIPQQSNLLVYEALVLRALERAGNRLRSGATVRTTPGKAYEAHVHIAANGSAGKVLEDAWDMATCVLDGVESPGTIVTSLDSYCRTLLANREPHTRAALSEWCRKTGI